MTDRLIVFDIEATGLSAKTDDIIEIGAVILDGVDIVDRFQTFVYTENDIPEKITELTGISKDMLEGAPEIEEALDMFIEFIGETGLVAHNATFDIGFIQEKLKRSGKSLIKNDVYDTLKLSRELLNTLQRHNLGVICKYLGVENPDHHRADNDSEVLAKVLIIFKESLRRQGKTLEVCQLK